MAWFRKPKYTTLTTPPTQRHRIPEGMWLKCPACLEVVTKKDWEENLSVCTKCGYHERIDARTRIAQLIDEGTFTEYDAELTSSDPLGFVDRKPYVKRIEDARQKTGETDAVVSGVGQINGREVSIAAMNFFFNGGSMGSVVGEKITRAMERGLEQRIPVLVVCASGGARMQEGMLSLMQLAKTSALCRKLADARLPYLVLMTNPTTAGVLASFASLGDLVVAEPDALIGFAGPRVIEQTIKQILPPGFQKSEFVRDHGFIDMVVQRSEMKETLDRLLGLLCDTPEPAGTKKEAAAPVEIAAGSVNR